MAVSRHDVVASPGKTDENSILHKCTSSTVAEEDWLPQRILHESEILRKCAADYFTHFGLFVSFGIS